MIPARAWLALALVVALAHTAILVGGDTFADLGWLGEIAPARHAAGDAIASGRLPAWWDHAGFGVPLLAEPRHGALYPPTWLAAAGGPALDLIAIAHLWLLAVGVAALARRLGADAAAALVAGACAALAGVTTGSLVGGALFAVAWTPWCASAALAIAAAAPGPAGRAARSRAGLGLALATAACALAGAPEVLAASVVLVPLIAGARDRGGAAAAWAAVSAVAGLLLAAMQLGPALLQAASGHAAGAEPLAPGLRLLELLAPGVTPPPTHGVASLTGGAAVIALAALARTRWLVVPAALVIASAFVPALAAVAWVWLAALGGVGLGRVAAADRLDRRTLVVAATVLAAMATALAAAALARYPLAAALDARGLDGAALVERGLARGTFAIGFAMGAVALALGAARRADGRLAALAGLLVVAQVALGGRAAVDRMPRPSQPPALLAALADRERPVRVLRNVAGPPHAKTERRDRGGDAAAAVARAAAASAAAWGIAAVPGTDPARQAAEDRLPAATAAVAARLIDRLAVPVAIVPRSIVGAANAPVLAELGAEALLDTGARRPPAFWAERWRHLDDDEALQALAPPPGQSAEPLGAVIIAGIGDDGGTAGAQPPPPRACALRRHHPAALTLTCDVTADGYAIVLDAWAPGWSAVVDGRPRAVERADLIARAVRVTAGARTIALTYTPPGWWMGVAISALTAVNLGLLGWLLRRRARRGA